MNNTATRSATMRIALLAVGNKDASQLWNLVDRFLAKNFVIGVSASADIAILDSDAHGFRETLRDWQTTRPGMPAIVIASNPTTSSPDVIYVRKPLNVSELIGVLGKLGNRFREERTAASEVVTVDICMSMDPMRVLDTIGIAPDVSGGLRYPIPIGGRLPRNRLAA